MNTNNNNNKVHCINNYKNATKLEAHRATKTVFFGSLSCQ